MGRSTPSTRHDVGASFTEKDEGSAQTPETTALKDPPSPREPSFAPFTSPREHHEYGVHVTGFQSRHQPHGGCVQGTPDGFQHREPSQGARPPLHHGHHAGGFSNRTQDGIHRFEPERIRTGTETEESGRNGPDGRSHLEHLSGQQFCPLALQADQRAAQQHAHQSPDGHVRVQGLSGHGAQL